jgi:hypothetical protein
VLARCGGKSELLVNVVRNETAAAMAKKKAALLADKRTLPQVSILVIVLDAVSRLGFYRMMVNTTAKI